MHRWPGVSVLGNRGDRRDRSVQLKSLPPLRKLITRISAFCWRPARKPAFKTPVMQGLIQYSGSNPSFDHATGKKISHATHGLFSPKKSERIYFGNPFLQLNVTHVCRSLRLLRHKKSRIFPSSSSFHGMVNSYQTEVPAVKFGGSFREKNPPPLWLFKPQPQDFQPNSRLDL